MQYFFHTSFIKKKSTVECILWNFIYFKCIKHLSIQKVHTYGFIVNTDTKYIFSLNVYMEPNKYRCIIDTVFSLRYKTIISNYLLSKRNTESYLYSFFI